MPSEPSQHRPVVERLVENRPLWSGYWSLVAHLAVGLLLAMLVQNRHEHRHRSKPIRIDSRVMRVDSVDGEAAAAVVVAAAADLPPAEDSAGTPDDELAGAATAERPDAVPVGPREHREPAERTPFVAAPTSQADDVAAAAAASGTAAASPSAEPDIADRPAPPGRDEPAGGRTGELFGRRRGDARAAAVRRHGGTAASEAAVDRGLRWLVEHQASDGSWRCDLSGCRCGGACRDAGSVASTTASTAIALLPFLGAGHTHEDGLHQQAVARGIYYLTSRLKRTPHGGDLCEGTMYGQGLATLALAEAYGMTGDDLLRDPLQEAIRFIETSQDQYSGGWRYLPGQPGDITVTAWQVAALKSASLAGLTVPSPAIDGTMRFLDRVQSMEGAAYGYRSPSAKHSTSAIGLLCRMYTGWTPGLDPLDRGIERLTSGPPDPNAIYENFYLSQVLLQASHPAWPRWNLRLRDALVRLQAKGGHETGSWAFDDRETAAGGRLAHTALAILVLEVYYRILPIYGEKAVEPAF